MITKYIVGDITETELKQIAHGVNCQNKMGSGVAKALYSKFPEVKTEYHRWIEHQKKSYFDFEPKHLLGQSCMVQDKDKEIFNCFTQLQYGYDGKKYVSYSAIIKCFEELVYFHNSGQLIDNKIAIPKIGCGLAGGDWYIVEQLINEVVGDSLEIWVYTLEETKTSGRNDIA